MDYNGPCWLAFVGKLESSREVWEALFNLQSLVSQRGRRHCFEVTPGFVQGLLGSLLGGARMKSR